MAENVLNPTNYGAATAQHANDRNLRWSGADTELRYESYLGGVEVSSDPADPPEGCFVIFQTDGTGPAGSDGDIILKVTAGGATKTLVLFDYSAAP